MRKLLALIAILLLVPSMTIGAGGTSTPVKSVNGGYRGMETSGELAVSEAGSAVTHTFNSFGEDAAGAGVGNVSNYFEIYYKATTGTDPLHVQVFRADGDSTFIAPSSVFLVYPDKIKPFFLKGINKVKIDLTDSGAVGIAVIDYYKT